MKTDPDTEAVVMNIIERCFKAFAKRDIDAFLAFFAPDPDMVAIGTGADEKCIEFCVAQDSVLCNPSNT